MLAQQDTANAPQTLAQITQVDVDGTTIRQLQQLWQNDVDGTPRLIFSASNAGGVGATVSPEYVQGTRSSRGSVSVTTAAVTIELARSGFTALTWTFADTGWTVASPSALTTAFRSPILAPDDSAETTAFVTATYPSGPDAVSNTIGLYANNIYIGTGIIP